MFWIDLFQTVSIGARARTRLHYWDDYRDSSSIRPARRLRQPLVAGEIETLVNIGVSDYEQWHGNADIYAGLVGAIGVEYTPMAIHWRSPLGGVNSLSPATSLLPRRILSRTARVVPGANETRSSPQVFLTPFPSRRPGDDAARLHEPWLCGLAKGKQSVPS